MIFRCPVCKKHIKAENTGEAKKNKFFPFCSERCRLIDLGCWFDSDYKIVTPVERQDENTQ